MLWRRRLRGHWTIGDYAATTTYNDDGDDDGARRSHRVGRPSHLVFVQQKSLNILISKSRTI